MNFVKQTMPPRASFISQCFGAGTGCGWCIPFLRKIHREVLAGGKPETENLPPEEYEAMRSRYLKAVKEGAHERHDSDRDEMPEEFAGEIRSDTSADQNAPPPKPPSALTPELRERLGLTKDPNWDVSDYFSRPRPPDPEPEDLGSAPR